jgi:hypothetical protein
MYINVFYDNYWIKLTKEEKIEKLQRLEDKMAHIQKRESRVVVETVDSNFCGDNADAQYNFEHPEKMFIRNIQSGFDSALSIIHEGIHAMYDDAFNGRINSVISYIKIDKKDIFRERINKNIIFNHFSHKGEKCLIIFQLHYVEEKIAHFDSKCYMLLLLEEYVKSISKSERNQMFFQNLFKFYEKIFICELNRILYIKNISNQMNIDYNEELKVIDYSAYEDKKEKINKPVISYGSSSIQSHFSSQMNVFKNIYSPLKVRDCDSNIEKFSNNFELYFKNL